MIFSLMTSSLTNSRISLLETSLKRLPFQLLPRVTYPPEQLEAGLDWQQQFSRTLTLAPRFSICLWCSGSRLDDCSRVLESLAVQSYRNFDVTLLYPNDSASASEVEHILSRYPVQGSAYQVAAGEGLVASLRRVVSQSAGDYLVVIADDTLIHPEGLFILAKTAIRKRSALIFSNEVVLGNDFQSAIEFYRKSPPDDLSLMSWNVLGEPLIAARGLLRERLGELEFQSNDISALVWAVAIEARAYRQSIDFIPLGLFCRRYRLPTPPSRDVLLDVERAVRRHGRVCGIGVKELLSIEGSREIAVRPVIEDSPGRIQVIIPFRDRGELTISCIKSLLKQDVAEDLEITLVDNGSSMAEHELIERFIVQAGVVGQVRVISDRDYFNYARLNNRGARLSVSPYILFLNNDVELNNPETVRELRRWCGLTKVGVVGGNLFYPDGCLQHGGINFSGVRPSNVSGPEQFSHVVREVNGVTFAMALVKRMVFDLMGGLDEFTCPNGFGDAVFCNEVRRRGYLVVCTPFATAIHHESLSRGRKPEELELYEMTQAGIMISDLFADVYARNQPTRLNLVELVANEEPLRLTSSRIARGKTRFGQLTNRLATRVFRAVGV